jgi:hypothetical protein
MAIPAAPGTRGRAPLTLPQTEDLIPFLLEHALNELLYVGAGVLLQLLPHPD